MRKRKLGHHKNARTGCQLYRHFDAAGDLLYAGISLSAVDRLSAHKQSDWYPLIATITIENFPSRKAAGAAELEVITCENPKYNKKRPYKGDNLIRKKGRAVEIMRPEYASWAEAFAAAHRIYADEMKEFYESLDDLSNLEITTRERDPEQIDW